MEDIRQELERLEAGTATSLFPLLLGQPGRSVVAAAKNSHSENCKDLE